MIQVLDQTTINQIAAGEVVERPAAVVKELVENAIDAGATAVTIEIKEGGISFIRVTDNGAGINRNEIKTAFLRHATSKIRTSEDLLCVNSLGFRGEALSSISAVAQVELITKERGEITGVRYEIHGGEERAWEEIGCPEGTTFIVRNLFYNTPARRKFLKTKVTEGNYIQDLVLRYSLAHSEIRFTFITDGRNKLQTSGDGQVKTNIYYNYGADITKCLIPVEQEENGIRLHGYVGKPELSRGNRSFINYFVNGRYIKSPIITKAVEDAYKEFLMNHRYPFVTLFLTIDSHLIDVNVHPTKMEIRFTNQEEIYHLFYDTIYTALKHVTLIPEVGLEPEKRQKQAVPSVPPKRSAEPFERIRQESDYKRQAGQQWNSGQQSGDRAGHISGTTEIPEKLQSNLYTQFNLLKEEIIADDTPRFRIIGQVFDTYWLLEYESELLIIDQHAAHEKVLFEKLMKRLGEKDGITQNLAAPVVISLSGREQEVLQENIEIFEQIGFTIEPFGDREYLITGIPADFLNIPSKELFLEMLDSMMEECSGSKRNPEMVLDHCATMACKAAVKGNNQLSFPEAKALFEEMLQMEQPYHCPHGRPTTIAMSKQEFEKKFKRIL